MKQAFAYAWAVNWGKGWELCYWSMPTARELRAEPPPSDNAKIVKIKMTEVKMTEVKRKKRK